jgi:hypothetical protein
MINDLWYKKAVIYCLSVGTYIDAAGTHLRADCNAMVERTTRGFTKNAKPYTPVIDKGPYGYQHINAAIQRRYADSMLNGRTHYSNAQRSSRDRMGRILPC